MAKFYDKGTYVQIENGDDIYRLPKNRFPFVTTKNAISIKVQTVYPRIFSISASDVTIPHNTSASGLGERVAEMYFQSDFDPSDPSNLTSFDGTDTTVGFADVTSDHEAIATVVEGDVTGDLTTTLDTSNNEVTVSSDNAEDSGVIHVELFSTGISL